MRIPAERLRRIRVGFHKVNFSKANAARDCQIRQKYRRMNAAAVKGEWIVRSANGGHATFGTLLRMCQRTVHSLRCRMTDLPDGTADLVRGHAPPFGKRETLGLTCGFNLAIKIPAIRIISGRQECRPYMRKGALKPPAEEISVNNT